MQRPRKTIHQARGYCATAFIKLQAACETIARAFESMQRPRETKMQQTAAKSSNLQQNPAHCSKIQQKQNEIQRPSTICKVRDPKRIQRNADF
jgi:hypothetical protein